MFRGEKTMPKPTTQVELLAACAKERAALEAFLSTLTPDDMDLPGVLGEWSVKDVLAHLVEWEQMVLGWLAAGERGESPAVPGEGFKWSQLPALNERIRAAWMPRPLAEVRERFETSYSESVAAIERLSDADLFTPGRWPWLRTSTLASYFGSCTASHYRWARDECRRGLAKRPPGVAGR
jgi:uncharacterized protein (TIGR03083 family)